MVQKILALLLGSVTWAAGARTEETFYQILGSDQTTVLCDSRIPGSCDPFLTQVPFLRFSAGSALTLFPAISPIDVRGDTGVNISLESNLPNNYFRFRHFFEEVVDLGWYAFEGGVGDFLAVYEMVGDTSFTHPSVSLISPFPVFDPNPFVARRETFGKPFRFRVQYRASLDIITQESVEHMFSHFGSHLAEANDLITGEPIAFELVPATPIPEPGGLSLFGLCALLGASARRKISVLISRGAQTSVVV